MMRALAGPGRLAGGCHHHSRIEMLRGIRKASSNWLGRIVMGVVLGLIAVSFAIWGIGDIFRGFGRSTVAKIGSTEITVDQFRQIYNDRLQQLGRQLGRPVTQDQARQLRLDQQLAGQLVAEAALDQRARQMRLNLSNDEIARQIMADPSFKGPSGQFERARFEAIIRNAGYNETRFATEQRKLTLRRELAETVSGDLIPPKTLEQAYNRYENEQRAIDYVTLDRSKAGDIAPPTTDQIQSYFESQRTLFRAPEYRSIVLMSLTPADVARPADVSDADAKRYYDTNLARYGTPERRQLEQIVFPTIEEAQAAAARIGENLSFEALAKERGMEAKDIDIGLLTKSSIIDRAIADAAFALPEGAVSAPIKGTFGTVLIKAVKIEPEQAKKFEEVSPEIKQTLANERARRELSARHDKVEDERGGGLRLAEIAPKLGLTALTIPAVDRSGLDPDGKQVEGLPSGVDVIAPAFAADVGVDAEPLQIPSGGYVWFDVTGVTPARERSLDDVRAQVEERWRNDEISRRLRAKATEMADKVKSGTPIADVAAAESVPVQTTFGLKRSGNRNTAISARVIDAVFQTAKGAAGIAEGNSPAEWVVFLVTDIAVTDFDAASPGTKRIADQMRRSLTEDMLAQYVQRLQTDIGATINLEALRRVSSGGTDQN
jgi:peptidyl-prolyl cis-trans isomerase D